jgi:hypothetical protein
MGMGHRRFCDIAAMAMCLLKGNHETLFEDTSLYLDNEVVTRDKKVLQKMVIMKRPAK